MDGPKNPGVTFKLVSNHPGFLLIFNCPLCRNKAQENSKRLGVIGGREIGGEGCVFLTKTDPQNV